MSTERAATLRRVLIALALAGSVAGCRTFNAVSEAPIFAGEMPSRSGTAIAKLAELPLANAYVQVGSRFDALVLLGMIGPGALETWYGPRGLTLVVDDARVLYTRGLPDRNIAESVDAGEVFDYRRLDCGRGRTHLAMPGLRYVRYEGSDEYIAELTESLRCSVEALMTPGYVGDALRVDEVIQFPPHQKTQLRTRWLHPGTGQLLRLQYAPSTYAPEIEILWFKVAANAH
ncbi:MAG TPA: YjbF family lipoprotein [Fontimonas sp.]